MILWLTGGFGIISWRVIIKCSVYRYFALEVVIEFDAYKGWIMTTLLQVYDVRSEEQRSVNGSLCNAEEAQVCAKALRVLADDHLGGGTSGANSVRNRVVILTPYRRQVLCITAWFEWCYLHSSRCKQFVIAFPQLDFSGLMYVQ